jgi:hypothetical protein
VAELVVRSGRELELLLTFRGAGWFLNVFRSIAVTVVDFFCRMIIDMSLFCRYRGRAAAMVCTMSRRHACRNLATTESLVPTLKGAIWLTPDNTMPILGPQLF